MSAHGDADSAQALADSLSPGGPGAASANEPRRGAEDALAKLRRLNRLRHVAPPSAARETVGELAVRLDAEVHSEGLLVRTETFPLPVTVGRQPLGADAFPAVPALERTPGERPGRLLVFDTETTGLAGGTGTVPFLLGLLVVEAGQARLFQWLMTRFDGEAAALDGLAAAVGRYDADRDVVITFNGSSFDLPLLETRSRLLGVRSPFEDTRHLDLVHVVRRAFAGRWADCRQQTAERALLEQRRVDDLPGAEVPERWFRWMRLGDGAGLAPVIEHNRLDLLGLAALVEPLAEVYADPQAAGARILPTYGAGNDECAVRDYLAAHRGRLDVSEQLELARLAKRAGEHQLACSVLEDLATVGNADACLQLAKLLEHQLGELDRALALTRTLAMATPGAAEVRTRESRLLDKIAARNARPGSSAG